ncbi:hypothetical protein WA026_012162 [Henosepilachna vigintioctopunctata]|uniref:Uncharacterized protein n=1 Tax=Henosepilachna vigintioctopunctata TaxID=420089 RepID=A0AAW1VFB4_9CUCU
MGSYNTNIIMSYHHQDIFKVIKMATRRRINGATRRGEPTIDFSFVRREGPNDEPDTMPKTFQVLITANFGINRNVTIGEIETDSERGRGGGTVGEV